MKIRSGSNSWIANFKSDPSAGITACNTANSQYRWVKFYIDKDNDVVSSTDTYVDENNCGKLCTNLALRLMRITDKAYPSFMRALYA